MACDRLGVERARKDFDEHGVYHVPNFHQPKVHLLVAGASYPFLLCRESLQDDVLVALVAPFVTIPREGHDIRPAQKISRRDRGRAPSSC